MNRAEQLASKWANAQAMMPGATIYLPEGEALVLGKADPKADGSLYGSPRLWWAWSVTAQAYVLIKDNDKRGNGGWYEYRNGKGESINLEERAG